MLQSWDFIQKCTLILYGPGPLGQSFYEILQTTKPKKTFVKNKNCTGTTWPKQSVFQKIHPFRPSWGKNYHDCVNIKTSLFHLDKNKDKYSKSPNDKNCFINLLTTNAPII